MAKGRSFLAINESINPERYIIATFYVDPTEMNLLEAAEAIASESSIGTWTSLSTMTDKIFSSLAPKIFNVKYLDEDNNPRTEEGVVKIAYPLSLWEEGSVPQLLSAVAGNVFGMKAIDNLKLLDLEFPSEYLKAFDGPEFGIDGIRKITEIYDRPLIGTIVKPKCGLPTELHAEVAYDSWVGGCDVVKDDENLTDQDFNPFEKRVIETLKKRDKAEKKTGKKKIYVVNITGTADQMLERAKFVKQHGGRCIMIDILTAGFAGVQYIRRQNLGMLIHGHRAMHAAFTNDPYHGISMMVVAKAARLSGVDQLHTGTVIGKMEGPKDAVLKINQSMRAKEGWDKLKTTMPIASGGLHPGHTEKLIQILGKDFIVNYGGGIHGHPDGTLDGAKAVYQSVEAALQGRRVFDVIRDPKYKALARAIEKWGVYGAEKEKHDDTYRFKLIDDFLEVQVSAQDFAA
ncbi:type III ribulose-bisphosphate carboxylase [Candidatus Dojkabacteria bacterium]|nr:type III ribulose-bisphosphate carboxylase [Candidatus Dojkabacteria bacterium]